MDKKAAVYAATVTPLDADLCCDVELLATHCQDLLNRGCSGVLLFGTTGEGPSFSVHERTEVLKKVINHSIAAEQVMIGNGSSCISDTIQLAHAALDSGCKALLIAPPCYFKHISDDGTIAFYREIIRKIACTDLKIILYHIPQFSGVPITLPVVAALCKEFPHHVTGIKESEGNLSYVQQVLQLHPHLDIYLGKEQHLVEGLKLNARGTICGLANLYPELICALCQSSEPLKQLKAFYEAKQDLPAIAAYKAVLSARKGLNWSNVRPPLVSLPPSIRTAFLERLHRTSLETLS